MELCISVQNEQVNGLCGLFANDRQSIWSWIVCNCGGRVWMSTYIAIRRRKVQCICAKTMERANGRVESENTICMEIALRSESMRTIAIAYIWTSWPTLANLEVATEFNCHHSSITLCVCVCVAVKTTNRKQSRETAIKEKHIRFASHSFSIDWTSRCLVTTRYEPIAGYFFRLHRPEWKLFMLYLFQFKTSLFFILNIFVFCFSRPIPWRFCAVIDAAYAGNIILSEPDLCCWWSCSRLQLSKWNCQKLHFCVLLWKAMANNWAIYWPAEPTKRWQKKMCWLIDCIGCCCGCISGAQALGGEILTGILYETNTRLLLLHILVDTTWPDHAAGT